MAQTSTVPSILVALRNGTTQSHRDLEGSIPLGRPDLNLADYVRTLQLFHAFVTEWESVGAQQCPAPFQNFFAGRCRAPLLENDLRFFEAAQLSARPDLSSICDAATFWGSMYVMEGSTLGGQVISRQLESNLGLSNRNGYSYFYGHGAETGAMWRTFTSVLSTESDSFPEEQIVAAARAQFDAFRAFFATAA